MGTELRRLKPETINRALIALRAELIREGGLGLKHVEALLQLRGDSLASVPRKAPPQRFKRGRLRLAIRIALRDGPITGPEIVARVAAAHGFGYREIYRSVYSQLGQMRRAGVVVREGKVWGLARHCGEAINKTAVSHSAPYQGAPSASSPSSSLLTSPTASLSDAT